VDRFLQIDYKMQILFFFTQLYKNKVQDGRVHEKIKKKSLKI